MAEVLAVENLVYTYHDEQPALRGVNFHLENNEILGIIGPNGAGKSTLLLHLNGLLRSSNGTVTVMGRLLDDSNLKWVRRNVGLVFQNPDDQLFSPTVFDDVAFGPLNLGFSAEEVSRRVTQALEWVGLSGYETRSPHHLSGGEKKRVALATVLCMSPSLLALDEPTSNLDPEGKWHLVELLKGLPGTKIIVTHDLDIVREICSRVLIMDRGVVVADGATETVMSDRVLLATHRLIRPDRIDPPLAFGSVL